MKVQDLITKLSLLNPNENVCAVVYGRTQFNNPDETVWDGICKEFDTWENVGDDIGQYLSKLISDRSII